MQNQLSQFNVSTIEFVPGEDYFICSQHFLVAWSSLSKFGAFRIFFFSNMSVSIDTVLVWVLFKQPYCWGVMVEASLSFLEDDLWSQVFGPLALTIFGHFLLWCFLKWRNCMVDVSVGAGLPMISPFMHFDQFFHKLHVLDSCTSERYASFSFFLSIK